MSMQRLHELARELIHNGLVLNLGFLPVALQIGRLPVQYHIIVGSQLASHDDAGHSRR